MPSKRRSSRKSPTQPRHGFADSSRGQRLQKVLAEAGVASRRACEELIEAGEVTVNGQPVSSLPAWADPLRDHIKVRGRLIRTATAPVYVMLFKPRGAVTTNDDPEGRTCATDLVRHPSRVRLFPVGRLDMDSSGLLLLTNDGELANQITHPRYHLPKMYEVTVKGALDEAAVKRLERGLFLTDSRERRGSRPRVSRTQGSRLKLLRKSRDRTRLLMELREGRNRQIRRMMARLGHPVKKLRRVQMGPLKLKGLRPGQWRDLTPQEVNALKRAGGRQQKRSS